MTPKCGRIDVKYHWLNTRILRIIRALVWANGHMTQPCFFIILKFHENSQDVPVKSSFLTIISHIGPTHLQRVWRTLGESLWQTGAPYLPILTDDSL